MATIEMKLKPWGAPRFATTEAMPRSRQDGIAPSNQINIPVGDLSADALRNMAQEWLEELYRKAGKQSPFFICEVPADALRGMPRFEDWWRKIENHSPRNERAYDDLGGAKPDKIERWMEAAFNAGRTPAEPAE